MVEMSDILVELVRNMTRRSMPIPQPPVGGRPCSSLYKGKPTNPQKTPKENGRVNICLIDPLSLVIALLLLLHLEMV
jgi:hypothetical protein